MATSSKTGDNYLVYTIQPFSTSWWWEAIHTYQELYLLMEGLLKCHHQTVRG